MMLNLQSENHKVQIPCHVHQKIRVYLLEIGLSHLSRLFSTPFHGSGKVRTFALAIILISMPSFAQAVQVLRDASLDNQEFHQNGHHD